MSQPLGLTSAQRREWERFVDLGRRIKSSTAAPLNESDEQQALRVARLLGNHDAFCAYYFGHYMDSEFGWFHRLAHRQLRDNPNYYGVWRFPREHAKSVFADVMEPLYSKALTEISGLMLGSANLDKASGLLHDIQAELENNERYNADFGQQRVVGDWGGSHFVTADGVGFWAFGAGQSPRGAREAEKRPNWGVIDDIDTKDLVRNETRVDETVDWVNEDFVGTLALAAKRFMLVGNRIAKYSVNARIAGDVEEGDKPKKSVHLIQVFALENPKTHAEDQSHTGVPAWKERYTRQQLETRFNEIGYRSAQREYFHKAIVEGKVFKSEWFRYVKLPALTALPYHATYNDPSFKDTKRNDYKAIVWLAKLGGKVFIVDCWVRQASQKSMVRAHFDMAMALDPHHELNVSHWFEANFIQDIHLDAYEEARVELSYDLFIRKDERAKPNKVERITNLALPFERDVIQVNAALRNKPDWITLREQFEAFPSGHDDGPDAVEGGYHKLNLMARLDTPPLYGAPRRNGGRNRL